MKHLHQHYHPRKRLLSTMLQRDMRQAASTVAQEARPQAEAAQGPGAQGGGRPHKRTVPRLGLRRPGQQKKKPRRKPCGLTAELQNKRRRPPTLPHCGAVPSAQPGLTSLFGMGRGGTPAQWPPGYAVPPGNGHAHRARQGAHLAARLGTQDGRAAHIRRAGKTLSAQEAFGQLVALGFGVAAFTPAPYQRRSLRRPYKEASSCGGLRA